MLSERLRETAPVVPEDDEVMLSLKKLIPPGKVVRASQDEKVHPPKDTE